MSEPKNTYRSRLVAIATAAGLTAATAVATTGAASAQDLPSFSSASAVTDNPTVSSLISLSTNTDGVGSLASVFGLLASGSLAAGSWQSVPGSANNG